MVLIGLGSNRGASVRVVREALLRLADFADGQVRESSLWRTSPVDCPPGSADFINAAAAFEPVAGLRPEVLLQALKALEKEFGRGAALVRNAPRELDLDLLLFGAEQRASAAFTLPHPRAVSRLFVLQPASEVLPEAVWPGTNLTIRELLDGLQTDERVVRVDDAISA